MKRSLLFAAGNIVAVAAIAGLFSVMSYRVVIVLNAGVGLVNVLAKAIELFWLDGSIRTADLSAH